MTEEYYVIVNLETLEYQRNGRGAKLREADKFNTLEEAKEELKGYDTEDVELAIYKVKEYKSFALEKVRE